MEVTMILAAFVIGVAATQIYERYRATHAIAWRSVVMGVVFIGVALMARA